MIDDVASSESVDEEESGADTERCASRDSPGCCASSPPEPAFVSEGVPSPATDAASARNSASRCFGLAAERALLPSLMSLGKGARKDTRFFPPPPIG